MNQWKPKTAVYFDGTDYFTLAAPGAGIANANPEHDEAWSLSFWLDGRVQGTGTIFSNSGDSSDPGWQMQIDSSGRLKIKAGHSTTSQTSTSLSTSYYTYMERGFVNVVFTYDGSGSTSGYTVYSNGHTDSYDNFGSSSISAMAPNATIQIGAGTSSGGSVTDKLFYRTVHNVSLWSKELTATEAHEIYHSQEAPGPNNLLRHSAASNLVAWWLASHASDSETTIYDRSSNSNNLTGVGFSASHIVSIR